MRTKCQENVPAFVALWVEHDPPHFTRQMFGATT
jgi:hypothetical protein